MACGRENGERGTGGCHDGTNDTTKYCEYKAIRQTEQGKEHDQVHKEEAIIFKLSHSDRP